VVQKYKKLNGKLILYYWPIDIDALRAKWNCLGICMLLMFMPYGQNGMFWNFHAIDVDALRAKWNCFGIFMLLIFMPYGQNGMFLEFPCY
jgi:hypothetical protein